MNKKNILYGIIPLVLASLLIVSSYINFQPSPVSASDEFGYYSIVCPTVIRANGDVETIACTHNVVFNDGLDAAIDDLSGASVFNFTSIKLANATNTAGSGVPVAAQSENFVEYNGCGLTAKNGTWANTGGTGNVSIYTTFTSSCDGRLVNVTRLSDILGARNLSGAPFTTTLTLNTNDQLTVNWTMQIN